MSANAKPFQLTGLHVLGGISTFFALVIGADIWFATLAYRSFSGQVADNPYEAGLLYNQTLMQQQAEKALGWTADIQTADNAVAISFRDRAGEPLNGLSVTGSLIRPATEAGKVELALKPSGAGVYAASVPRLTGAWDIRATAVNAAGETFRVERRVIAP